MRLLINRRNQLDGAYLDDLRVIVKEAAVEPIEQTLEQVVDIRLCCLELAPCCACCFGTLADEHHIKRHSPLNGPVVCEEERNSSLVCSR